VPSKWSWIALGAGAYLAFTISMFPAGAYQWFAPANVSLVGVEGTIWNGSAAVGSIAGLGVRDVRWRLRALPLVIGRLGARFEARLADGFVSGSVVASIGGVELNDVTASTSLPVLREVLPLKGVEGLASAALETLRIEDGWPSAVVGNLRIAQLQVVPFMPTSQPGLMALGDYEVTFTDTGGRGLAASFRDTGGPLEVTGTLTVGARREYMLDGFVKPRANAPQALVDGLTVMTGEPDASGRRQVTLTGTL
jgi:general secretion pathway protein N